MENIQKEFPSNWFIWFHELFGLDFFKFSGPRTVGLVIYPFFMSNQYNFLFIFLQVEPRTSVTDGNSSSALITASVVTAIAALIVGYLAGFLTARKCSKDYKSCGHHYLEHHLSKYVLSTFFILEKFVKLVYSCISRNFCEIQE